MVHGPVAQRARADVCFHGDLNKSRQSYGDTRLLKEHQDNGTPRFARAGPQETASGDAAASSHARQSVTRIEYAFSCHLCHMRIILEQLFIAALSRLECRWITLSAIVGWRVDSSFTAPQHHNMSQILSRALQEYIRTGKSEVSLVKNKRWAVQFSRRFWL